MNSDFSNSWKSSVQPRKQRKYVYNAPDHIKGKFLSAHLSKELKEKHNIRSIRVRVGDTVKVVRGQFKGKTGEVEAVDIDKTKLFVAGVELSKQESGKVKYPVHPSNVVITKMKNDARRIKDKKTMRKQNE